MMRTAARRLQALQNHIMKASTSTGLHSSPNLVVTPKTSLIDQKVHIRLHGLEPNQRIRLVASVRENSIWFESSGLFIASDAGEIDLNRDPSLGGTYTGTPSLSLSLRAVRQYVLTLRLEEFTHVPLSYI